MLTKIRIHGFRALDQLEVPLRPLTVLIGNNDSGKSSFLRAIDLLASPSPNHGQHDHYMHQPLAPFLIEGRINDAHEVKYGSNVARVAHASIQPTATYQLRVDGIPMVSDGYDDRSGAQPLRMDGWGVPGLLDYFLRTDRARFDQVVDVVKSHVPGVQELAISTPHPSHRRLDLVLEHGFRMPADEASAGVRLLLFFIALTYHPSPPKLILLEEPENGVLPRRLADVLSLLKEITRGEHGQSAAQVILTTHSPYLLDSVDVEDDQVLVFRREESGRRTAEPVDEERLKLFLDEFMLGEVWYNQGEAGLVAK